MSALKELKDSAEALARRFATSPSVASADARDSCRARTMRLVKTGRLVRAACERCGAEKVQAHHENYRRPDFVRWLCHKCHHGVHHRGWLLPLRLPTRPTDDEAARWIAGGLMRGIADAADAAEKLAEEAERRGGARLYLTLAEASALTGLSERVLRRKCRDGSLPAIRDVAWKIKRTDLEQL